MADLRWPRPETRTGVRGETCHSATSVTAATEAELAQPAVAAETSFRMSEALRGILLRDRMFLFVTSFLSAEEHPDMAFWMALRRFAWLETLTKAPLDLAARRALCLEGALPAGAAALPRDGERQPLE